MNANLTDLNYDVQSLALAYAEKLVEFQACVQIDDDSNEARERLTQAHYALFDACELLNVACANQARIDALNENN